MPAIVYGTRTTKASCQMKVFRSDDIIDIQPGEVPEWGRWAIRVSEGTVTFKVGDQSYRLPGTACSITASDNPRPRSTIHGHQAKPLPWQYRHPVKDLRIRGLAPHLARRTGYFSAASARHGDRSVQHGNHNVQYGNRNSQYGDRNFQYRNRNIQNGNRSIRRDHRSIQDGNRNDRPWRRIQEPVKTFAVPYIAPGLASNNIRRWVEASSHANASNSNSSTPGPVTPTESQYEPMIKADDALFNGHNFPMKVEQGTLEPFRPSYYAEYARFLSCGAAQVSTSGRVDQANLGVKAET